MPDAPAPHADPTKGPAPFDLGFARLQRRDTPSGPVWWLTALDLGTVQQRFLPRHPPTPLDLERTIAWLEDQIMAATRTLPGHGAAPLWAPAEGPAQALQALAQALGQPAELPLEVVESAFQRLSAIAEGRPLSQDPTWADPQHSTALLVLRELLHHLPAPELRLVFGDRTHPSRA